LVRLQLNILSENNKYVKRFAPLHEKKVWFFD